MWDLARFENGDMCEECLAVAGTFIRLFTALLHFSPSRLWRHCSARPLSPSTRIGTALNIQLSLAPLISLVAGLLILVMPKLLNIIVALYLIVIGVVGLFGAGGHRLF
jgi:hypothetical protein